MPQCHCDIVTEDASVCVHRPFMDTAGLKILAPVSRYSYYLYEYRQCTVILLEQKRLSIDL